MDSKKKHYTPRAAARAMINGKTLKNAEGWNFLWDKKINSFIAKKGRRFYCNSNFNNLFEELT